MHQTTKWNGDFGSAYLERNDMTMDELDYLYVEQYGKSRTEMNLEFLGSLTWSSARILEVGCGSGMQLRHLGSRPLFGIDVCREAVIEAKVERPQYSIIHGRADDIPFKDNFFDMVFTSGLLIHIPPQDLLAVMGEMVRCCRHYIWGFEYFSTTEEEIEYRGESNLLWKRDHAWLFQEHFGLELIEETFYRHGDQPLYETMYLLKKPC